MGLFVMVIFNMLTLNQMIFVRTEKGGTDESSLNQHTPEVV